MDWHSVLRKKVRGVVPVTGLACCWLLLNAVAAEGGRPTVTDSFAKQHRSVRLVNVDLLGITNGDRQWAADPQWGGAAFSGIAGQPVQPLKQSALEPAQQPIARLKGAPVWRF